MLTTLEIPDLFTGFVGWNINDSGLGSVVPPQALNRYNPQAYILALDPKP